ncbi:MAG: SET domain-containing protein [Flammeovirgaceae bacterium]|nr:SET domain-containing protein [Flammeovirgaceae bacterium]
MTSKEKLLQELAHNTYVMLRPSPVGGVGVFAIREIPKGCRSMFSNPDINEKWIKVSRQEVEALPTFTQDIIVNYCLFDADAYFVPEHGFKKLDSSYYLNHSANPNLVSINEGEYFEATRDIKANEELFLDYGTIVEGDE